jgi:acyl-ACP thioesterase
MSVDPHVPTELVDPPENGRVFVQPQPHRVGLADCAPSGRMRLDAVARWLQDIAYADVEDAGLAQTAVWVVRRTRLRIDRFPRFGERFEGLTFCSGVGPMWAERRTTFTRVGGPPGEVEAVSLWVHLDPVSWRPAPFTAEELAAYGDAAAARRIRARLRHPPPGAAEELFPWRFRATECDIAGHINNAAYWAPLEEELLAGPDPDPPAMDVEMEYRTPCQPGAKRVLRDGRLRWIVSGDGEAHASVLIAAG